MKKKQYFPLEVNLINSDNVSMLIEELGPRGFGIYIMVLSELRHSPNYRCALTAIRGMARRCKVSRTLLSKVLTNFRLFEIIQGEDDEIIASPYLDRVMGEYEEKCRNMSEAAVKRNNKYKRDHNGQFADNIGVIEKKRIEKNKKEENTTTTTTVVVDGGQDARANFAAAAADYQSWEKHLDAAVNDEAWMELLAMNSGFSQLFVKHPDFVVEAFRKHVRLQGNEASIYSVNDAKAYFANFLRPGTPTQKRLAEQLTEREREIAETSPYRFETIDPKIGERTYYGNPIPAQAPPRPNDNAVWSPVREAWI